MTSNLGLPRYVLSFLRHMESHKDCLKWNIAESSHKITLTLTWNFHKDKGTLRENLMRKINRTLHIAQTQSEEREIPSDIRALLDNVPKKHKRTRLKRRLSLSMSAVRRTLSSSQTSMDRSSSLSLPRYSSPPRHARTPQTSTRSMVRNHSFHGYAYHSTPRSHSFSRTQSTTFNSRSHRSHNLYETCQSMNTLDYQGSQDLLHSPSANANVANRSPYQQRAKLHYRSETSLEDSLEELMDKARKQTEEKLKVIKDEWDETIRDWPNIVVGRASRRPSFKRSLTSPRLNLENEERGFNGQGTVNKCLDSCEKILNRYETTIK